MESTKRTLTLFSNDVQEAESIQNDVQKTESIQIEKLVAIQAEVMATQYNTTCFDVKQLQKILRVGESNVYRLLRSGKLAYQTIGKRKVVPVAVLAQYLFENPGKKP